MNTSDSQTLPVEIAECDFRAKVLESKQPVLVQFWVPWCRSCQVHDLVLKQVAGALAGKAKTVKVNADACPDLRFLYDIEVIPTLLYFIQGEALIQIAGDTSREEILASLETVEHHRRKPGLSRDPRPCVAHQPMSRQPDGRWMVSLESGPGYHQYLLPAEGTRVLDPNAAGKARHEPVFLRAIS